jgi:hypothetical protein
MMSEQGSTNTPVSPHVPEHLREMMEEATASLNAEDALKVQRLVLSYTDVFVGEDGELGRTDLVDHHIETGGARPIKCPYRPPGFARKNIIETELEDAEKGGS